ncbi:MAG: dihydrouridine synthase [Firmicutes bacterium HGW-Firmicutes-7]|nr:MAG: dihydrouridine synthase [Firmicutes bacterium HGW-Firmicutes-7]
MNLFLAPIQGITMACYRNSFAKIFGGIDAYYSPFITTSDIKKASPSLFKDLLPEHNDAAVKMVPQLLSNDGSDFRLFASALVDMGYNEINWNIGCPFPMVTNKKKGAGILPYPDMLKKFLDIACGDSNYKITVKMRLGLDNPEEGMDVIKLLNEYPLSGVIIHARTGIQMYTGNVDLDSFEVLHSACNHEATYNGDIFTFEDFKRIQDRFPSIKNFMLGRGALRNPFLPSIIKGQIIPSTDKMSMIRHFHDEIYNHYKNTLFGDRHLCDKMREFWFYMSVHTDKDGKFMKKIKKCQSAADYLDTINLILNPSCMWSNSPLR